MTTATKLSRVDDAYERLKRETLNNALPPSPMVREAELALPPGMSRTPAGEALIRLANEDLVDLVPRRAGPCRLP